MIHMTTSSRQPARLPWTMERLIHERSILLGMAIDTTTALTYSSATNSYLAFCKHHQLPVDPTPETLSYYITFQSSHINPKSVESYLSGICSCLKPFFPNIRANQATALVKRMLKGARRRHGRPTTHKAPLTTSHLCAIANSLHESRIHDDMLFLAMINTGFAGLLRLGEMAMSDSLHHRDSRKEIAHSSLS
jgi:hypothetical protein